MRNPVFDIMKGIGILLVITGHLKGINPALHRFIFSFHMPLFFILAGYFYKLQEPRIASSKDFKRLIYPYLFTCALINLYQLINLIKNHDISVFLNTVVATFWGNGSVNHSSHYFADMPSIGAIWFLLALFWSKIIYNRIPHHKRYTYAFVLILSIMGTFIDRYVVNLPFAILPGISALVFFAAGNYAKQNNISWKWLLLGIPVWIYCITFSGMSIVRCYYNCYPLDVIGGITGTYAVYLLSKTILSFSALISCAFTWLGKNSLAILCFHLLVMTIPFIDIICRFSSFDNYWIKTLQFFILPIIFTFLSRQIPFTRKIFGN
jgi:fucose 4-O-acetylase-like acetyltransferase